MLTKEEKAGWEKSVRLNHGTRSAFVDHVIKDVMPDEQEPTIENFADKWQNTLYDDIYTPEIKAAMKACPSWMFYATGYYFVNMEADKKPRRGNVLKFKAPRTDCLAPEKEDSDWGGANENVGIPTIPGDHPASIEFVKIEQLRRDWFSKKSNLREQLSTVANDCNTSHQLYEAWPTALNYAKACFPYVAPAEAQRGGHSTVSAQEIDIGVMMAKSNVSPIVEN